MKITDLDVELKQMDGTPIKTTEKQPSGAEQDVSLTLRRLILRVLKTEKIVNDSRTGFVTVNDKSEEQKLSDFSIGMKVAQADKGVELKPEEKKRIIDLAHYLETEIYGALVQHLNK